MKTGWKRSQHDAIPRGLSGLDPTVMGTVLFGGANGVACAATTLVAPFESLRTALGSGDFFV